MKKVGHTSEFLFSIYWWAWKTIIKKTDKCANKKCENFNIYNVLLSKKIKKNTWRYHHFRSLHQKSWSYDLQFLGYRVWQTEIGNFGSFFALLPHSTKNHHFIQMYWKPQSYEVWFLRYGVRRIIFIILGYFLP